MKRAVQIVVLLILLFLVYQFVSMLLINEHTLSYIITNDDKNFQITEKFKKVNHSHDYFFEIEVDDHQFVFHNTSNLNKKKQVIDHVEYFTVGNLFCIYPVIEEKGESKQNDILCDQAGKLVTYSYLRQQNNKVVDAFVQNLQQKEYSNISWDQFDEPESFEQLTLYPKNMVEGYHILLWNYRGIDIVNHDSKYTFHLLNQDRYENTLSRLVGKYYIFPNYDSKHEFNEWYSIDVVDWTKETLNMDQTVSFDSYVNGVVDGKLYLVDKDNQKQFAVDPKKKEVQEVGNVDLQGKYYYNQWEDRNFYDFMNQNLYFQTSISLESMSKKYGDIEVKKSNQEYYFKTSDGSFYETFEGNLEKEVLLFQDANVVDWKVVDNVIYFLSGSTIYQYDNYTGLKKVVQSNELKYNYQNIFEVYKK